ncbi:tyrosine-type recombinase/integrase [Chitinolyticbacter meiyuanensis]|uniref:tyrosine-type recombinase/integrase n=1 Tax=Chitinolyticbacter meiyuanensis TaxID=682798 RepID=UPI0011E5E894|nr:site-specific integrase [Chitinolyticbacter meiyuanensis]
MPIKKRGTKGIWWIDIVTPTGERIRQSAGTQNEKEAQELHDRMKSKLWEQSRLNVKREYLWEEAAIRYLKEIQHKKSLDDDKRYLRWWTEAFRGRAINSITKAEAAEVVEKRYSAPASRNRMIATLRALLNTAIRDWEWIDHVPAFRVYEEPDGRIRWLTQDHAARLIERLPPWLATMARFALATGLRQSNVYELTWDRVDLRRRCVFIPGSMFKSGKDFYCVLSDDAVSVIRGQLGKHSTHVFVDRNGQPMSYWPRSNDSIMRKEMKSLGITDFVWHDWRHTWASWHVQGGTDIYTLKRLGGWETIEMPQRYAHLCVEHLLEPAQVTNLAQVRLTSAAQQKNKADESALSA